MPLPIVWLGAALCYIGFMKLFKRSKKVNIDFPEIHTYVDDLKEMTKLRNSQPNSEERERYDRTIEVMQKVMIRLNERGLK